MSWQAINWVQHMPRPEGFSSSHRAVLATLANLADARDGHQVQRPQRELAAKSWVSERTCRDALRDIIAAGIADRVPTRRPDGNRGIDIIRLNVPNQPASSTTSQVTEPARFAGSSELQPAKSVQTNRQDLPRNDSSTDISLERARSERPQPDPLVAAAMPLIVKANHHRLKPSELGGLLACAVTAHGADKVQAEIERLAAEGAIFEWPKHLIAKLKQRLSTSRRPGGPCSTCGGCGAVPAAVDPSRRARCPDCTGRDTPPVQVVELPAEPVVKPEAAPIAGPDPWGVAAPVPDHEGGLFRIAEARKSWRAGRAG